MHNMYTDTHPRTYSLCVSNVWVLFYGELIIYIFLCVCGHTVFSAKSLCVQI